VDGDRGALPARESAAPSLLVHAVGVTWLAPVAGAYLAAGLLPARPAWKPLLRALLVYAFLVRGFVAGVGLVATRSASAATTTCRP